MIYNNEINRIKRFGDTHSMGVTRLGDHCSLNPQASLTSRRSLKRDTRWIRWSELVSFSLSSPLLSLSYPTPSSFSFSSIFLFSLFIIPTGILDQSCRQCGVQADIVIESLYPFLPLSSPSLLFPSSACFFVVFYFKMMSGLQLKKLLNELKINRYLPAGIHGSTD